MGRTLANGRVIAHYRVLSHLGSGGMGEVYLAEDSRLGRRVALKVLSPQLASDEDRLKRFGQEARTIATLNHPNILTIYDVGQSDDVRFVATEFVEGETLRAYLDRQRPDLTDAIEIASQVASALGAAHEAGVVHRDIKPENVMLRQDGLVKVLDFGLAKLGDSAIIAAGSDEATRMLVETKAGVVLGTFSHMSPEQARGQHVDGRSDIFSLGVVLYEMIAGQSPFNASTAADVLAAIVHVEPPALGRLTSVPPSIDRIVKRMLEKDRVQRYQAIGDLLSDLRRAQRELSEATTDAGSAAMAERPSRSPGPKEGSAVGGGSSVTAAATTRRKRVRRGVDSLAVLPLAHVGLDAEAEYLTDGITESLINTLSQLPRLRVMARSTVFRYKGRDLDPQAVGRDLNVRAVLTGRVQQRGDNVITAIELVDVDDGSRLWGAQLSRPAADVLALQEELSREITDRLRLRLTGDEKKRLAKRHTVDPEAYQLYLRGRYFLNKRTPEGLTQAFDLFQQAVARDPKYALAYAGLADAYALAGAGYAPLTLEAAFAKAKEFATKALEIDPALAEAHASLAFLKFRFEWDWDGAERAFRRALELNPGHAPSHHWHAMFLASRGRFDEALAEMERARELDPLSMIMMAGVGRILHFAGRYAEAIDIQRQVLRMDPSFVQIRFDLGISLVVIGKYDEAAHEFQAASEVPGFAAPTVLLKGMVAALQGRAEEARQCYSALEQRQRLEGRSADDLALLAVTMGDQDSALKWLRVACETHASILAYVNVEPAVAPLRQDPRCRELLQSYGLVPVSSS
jgi:serine/threonine-protein kinase